MGRHNRQASVNRIIHNSLRAAGVPSALEPTGLCRNDGKRPDGATLVPWSRGRCLVWDATVVHRLADSYHAAALADGSTVANAAEVRKIAKYTELNDSYVFEPLAFETLGGVGQGTWKFLRFLSKLIEETTGQEDAFLHLRQRLAITIQMGNTACICESLNRDCRL